MIRFTILTDDDYATAFKAVGHAGYAENGSDIVCSAITSAMNLAIELLYISKSDFNIGYFGENGVLVHLTYPNKTGELAMWALYRTIVGYEKVYPNNLEVRRIEV
jgi:uncharacterized protein YsxB (DUF464 family)